MFINRFGEIKKLNDFFQDLWRERIKDSNNFALLVTENRAFSRHYKTIHSLIKEHGLFEFFGPNLYWHKTGREKEHVGVLMAVPFDCDWAKKDPSIRKYSTAEMFHLIKERTGIEPSYLWWSNTDWCYQGLVLIEPVPATPKSIHLYEWITREFARKLDFDQAISNANQLQRKPKEKTYFRAPHKFSDKVYDLDELKFLLPTEKELEKRRKSYGKKGDVSSFREEWILKQEAIQYLLSGEYGSYRNNAAFTIALLYRLLDKSEEETLAFLSGDWFQKVNLRGSHFFEMNEVRSTVKSAYSGKYLGPSRQWIELITGIEFEYNINYIRTKYNSADEVRTAIISYLRENNGITIKQPELAEKIKMPLRSVEEQIKKLKKEGILEYKTQRGRYSKGTTFNYTGTMFDRLKVEVKQDGSYQELDETYGVKPS
jgi:DNA-binding transcriptional ArsR family regulator